MGENVSLTLVCGVEGGGKGERPSMIIIIPTLKSRGSKVEDLIVFGALLSTGPIYRHLRQAPPLHILTSIPPLHILTSIPSNRLP